jgi:hypothetical protein
MVLLFQAKHLVLRTHISAIHVINIGQWKCLSDETERMMQQSFHKYYNSGIKSHWSDQSHNNLNIESSTGDVTKSNSNILIHGCKTITQIQISVLKNITLYSNKNQVIVWRNILYIYKLCQKQHEASRKHILHHHSDVMSHHCYS